MTDERAGVQLYLNSRFKLDLELQSLDNVMRISCDVVLSSIGVNDLQIGLRSIGGIEFTGASYQDSETRNTP